MAWRCSESGPISITSTGTPSGSVIRATRAFDMPAVGSATVKIEELMYGLKENYTIVIVTHNLQQAARVSDRTAFFWLGRLVPEARVLFREQLAGLETQALGGIEMARHALERTIEAVVVEDHDLGQLDVLVLERLEHAVELLEDHVDPAQRRFLEAPELLLEVLATLAAHQPNFPVTYSSVRLSSGVENILSVAACSIISPASMKAVVSATRAACCMLWVTMTIV